MGEEVNHTRVSAITRTAGLAVDDDLGAKSDWGGVETAVEDVESVSNGRGGALGPA